MGSRYLTALADVMRGAGLDVTEVGAAPSTEGVEWKHRARGSGGYESGRPNHIIAHHTAGAAGGDSWGEVNYCTFGNDNAPVCNLYLGRAGEVFVCAAGATNTNGSGDDPCGVTPEDSMNSHAIGIEAGNNGAGEPWPTVQQNSYVTMIKALCDEYDIPVERVHSHFEWAPGRKIDPAGSSRYASGGDSWDMDAFRGDIAAGEPEPEPPVQGDDDMLFICKVGDVIYVGDGVRSFEVPAADEDTLEANIATANRWHQPARAGLPLVTSMADIVTINTGQRDLLVGRLD